MTAFQIIAAALGAWGGVLSTLLALIHLRAAMRRRVTVTGEWLPDENAIYIELVNVAVRPLTITTIDIAYGEIEEYATPILTVSQENVRLADGETRSFRLDVADLQLARERIGLEMRTRARVWVRARVAGLGFVRNAVRIDPKAIGASGIPYRQAEPFVAADLLVGFAKDRVFGTYRSAAHHVKNK